MGVHTPWSGRLDTPGFRRLTRVVDGGQWDSNDSSAQEICWIGVNCGVMIPDWSDRLSIPPLRALLLVVLGSAVFGAGLARYAQVMEGSGPLLDVLFVSGLWSVGGVLVVVAALPTAFGYNASYSYAIAFGVLFGAVSVIGVATTQPPMAQVEKFGYAFLLGVGSALLLGTLAVIGGHLWSRLLTQRVRGNASRR